MDLLNYFIGDENNRVDENASIRECFLQGLEGGSDDGAAAPGSQKSGASNRSKLSQNFGKNAAARLLADEHETLAAEAKGGKVGGTGLNDSMEATEHEKPVAMQPKGYTDVFPRKDNLFTLKEAMPYDEIYTKVWAERPRNVACEEFKYWFAFVVMGVLIGIVGFFCILWVQCLCDWVMMVMHVLIYSGATQDDPSTYNVFVPYLWFTGMSGIFGLIASSMTTYWAQGAAMSGLPEMIGWVNGVNYPDYVGLNILFTKMVGNCLAMGAKLCVGKEGPLAHCGSNCGILALYLPGFPFQFLQNDTRRREFLAAGCATGVAIAFGAPVGGPLFVYEMCWPNGFFRQHLLRWKVFMATCIATFLQTFFFKCWTGTVNFNSSWGGTVVWEFYRYRPVKTTKDIEVIFVMATIMGCIGGCAGSLFININTLCNIVRRRYLTTKRSKVIECTLFCIATSSILYWFSYTGTCQYQDTTLNGAVGQEYAVQPYKNSYLENFRGWCPPSQIEGEVLMNSIATYYWASSAQLENHAVHGHLHFEHIPLKELLLFISFYYFFFLPSYGTNLPAGLFSPGIIMGICYGNVAFTLLTDKNYVGMEVDNVLKRKLMCLGCCGIISAYVRLKYSVCVILLEIFQDWEMILPMFWCAFCANTVADQFTRGAYQRLVRTKQMPILSNHGVRECCKNLKADYMMERNVDVFRQVETVENIKKIFEDEENNHHGFPIVNKKGTLIGIIPRNHIINILKQKNFYHPLAEEYKSHLSPEQQGIMDKYRAQNKLDAAATKKQWAHKINTESDEVDGIVKSLKELHEDQTMYPLMPKDQILPWQYFLTPYLGMDREIDDEVKDILEEFGDQRIDFRPYMCDTPTCVLTTDSIEYCVRVFRSMALRHMCVLLPNSGKLAGIITRQDLFLWMDL